MTGTTKTRRHKGLKAHEHGIHFIPRSVALCLCGCCYVYCLLALTVTLAAQTPVTARVGAESEFIAEIRTHGNARIADEEIVRVAGIQVGQRLEQNTLMEVEERLRKSGSFDTVEIRKRYRSLEDFSQVALLLVVHERLEGGGSAITRPLRRIRSRAMFLPIAKYDDGYGWTYGVHSSTSNVLGLGERLSVPLTWGGTKRAALELDRTFEHGPLTRVQSSFGVSSQRNPRFLLTDHRRNNQPENTAQELAVVDLPDSRNDEAQYSCST